MYSKDFAALEKHLEAADDAFMQATDEAGREVVQRMRRCLGFVRDVDDRWGKLQVSLHTKEYGPSVKHLLRVRHFLQSSKRGLAFVNAALDTVTTVVCNDTFSAHGMVAELALQDAEKAAEKAAAAARSGQLSDAQELAKEAQMCYTWVASTREQVDGVGVSRDGAPNGGAPHGTPSNAFNDVSSVRSSVLGGLEEGNEDEDEDYGLDDENEDGDDEKEY